MSARSKATQKRLSLRGRRSPGGAGCPFGPKQVATIALSTRSRAGLSALTTILSTEHMSCREACGVVKKHGVDATAPDGRFTKGGHFKVGSFGCRTYLVDGEDFRAACHDGLRRFRVDYGA